MKWKAIYTLNDVEVIAHFSSWKKLQVFVKTNPELTGTVWEKIKGSPHVLFCRFTQGLVN